MAHSAMEEWKTGGGIPEGGSGNAEGVFRRALEDWEVCKVTASPLNTPHGGSHI